MTPLTNIIVLTGINDALRQWVESEGGMIFRDNGNVEDFLAVLNLVVGVHENLITQFTPDKEIEDAVQGRDRANWPQNVNAPYEAEAVRKGGW